MFLLMLQEGEREEVVTKDRVVEVILDEVVVTGRKVLNAIEYPERAIIPSF